MHNRPKAAAVFVIAGVSHKSKSNRKYLVYVQLFG